MRHLLAVVLVSATMVADAQVIPNDVRAPVNVAGRLYTDCIDADLMGLPDIEPTRVGINAYVQGVDEKCLRWTMVWFPSLTDGRQLAQLPADQLRRFNTIRMAYLQGITNGLRKEAMIR